MNANARSRESYKGTCQQKVINSVLFLARHGEGFHNIAESFYGTPAWNCYWAQRYGNGTITWVTPCSRI
jgi:hypothetical protein